MRREAGLFTYYAVVPAGCATEAEDSHLKIDAK